MGEIAEVLNNTELVTRFENIAPSGIVFEAEKGFAVQAINNNPMLAGAAQASPNSLMAAVTNVAAIGLSLNPAKKEAYLIPRSVKVNDRYVSKVFLEPSYMGLCNLATGSGRIEWIQAQTVREADTFEYAGIGEKPKHTFNAFKDRGDIVGVYAVAKTNQGDFLCDLMDLDKINSIMERSESVKSARRNNKTPYGPWVTDFEEMAKKSVVRMLFKMLPKNGMERMEQAVNISNDNEGFEPIETAPSLKQFNAEQKAYFDDLIENENAIGMHAFISSIEEQVFINLYHSFPKGQKGTYQKLVNSLNKKGREQIVDIGLVVKDAISSNDAIMLNENIEGLSIDEINLIKKELTGEEEMIFNEMADLEI